MFSIIIPTWNNLASLQLCVRSIQENSDQPHQIIVHVNDGSDGTLNWVKESHLDHSWSERNVGICYALNEAATRCRNSLIYYLNDDMYCCPGWDTALKRWSSKLSGQPFVLSSLPIEPIIRNLGVLVQDFGRTTLDFQERELLQRVKEIRYPDFYGVGRVPHLIPKDWWFRVGGYSIEFSPGTNSDDDFAMKMWNAGCRVFIGVGDSLVYHFTSESTSRHEMNNGNHQFLRKWGMTARFFRQYYLRQGLPFANHVLSEPENTLAMRWYLLRGKVKRKLI